MAAGLGSAIGAKPISPVSASAETVRTYQITSTFVSRCIALVRAPHSSSDRASERVSRRSVLPCLSSARTCSTSWGGLQPLLVEMLRQPQLLHACFLHPTSNFPQLFAMSRHQEVGVLLSQRSAYGCVCSGCPSDHKRVQFVFKTPCSTI